jgi:hypothetical protein
MEAQELALLARHPGLKIHPVSSTDEVLQGLDDGKCKVGVTYEDAWVTALQHRRNCNKSLVGLPLFSIGNGMPVREEYSAAFSWAISLAQSAGTFED